MFEATKRPLQRSTEYYGLGQSGYTAGRVEGDYALELQMEDRNLVYRSAAAEPVLESDEDDRFTGRGGHHPSRDDNAATVSP